MKVSARVLASSPLARLLSALAFTAIGIGVFGPSARAADAGAPSPPPSTVPACISVKTESRYVPYGYNHIVILTNGCARSASCTVSTDVTPEPRAATVPPGQTVEVTTFMGSPSSAFTAKVGCELRERGRLRLRDSAGE
jgi:hypothetical protein